jgi:hypothetical protein
MSTPGAPIVFRFPAAQRAVFEEVMRTACRSAAPVDNGRHEGEGSSNPAETPVNLADWLRRSPRHSSAEQLAVVASLAQAVEEGHRDGTRYAGWSPSRIKVGSDGAIDLSGIAAAHRASEDLAYTAPESADGTTHTARSDVYSAGVILYEVLAGTHPFGGLSVRQPRGAPKPLRDVRPDISRDLADAVSACLERDPDWRPADLSYVLQVVRDLVKTPPPPAARTASSGRVPVAGRRDAGPSFGAASSGPSRMLPLVLGLVVLAGSGAAFWLYRSGRLPGMSAEPSSPSPAAGAADGGAADAGGAAPAETPTPEPTASATATPEATVALAAPTTGATATPTVRATAIATATAAPKATVIAAATVTATVAPTVAPTSTPEPTPVDPPSLKSLSPPKIRRGSTTILDVRGQNFRADQQVKVVKGKDAAAGVLVGRQRIADPTLLQVVLVVDASAPGGAYSLSIVDAEGRASNALPFEIAN